MNQPLLQREENLMRGEWGGRARAAEKELQLRPSLCLITPVSFLYTIRRRGLGKRGIVTALGDVIPVF